MFARLRNSLRDRSRTRDIAAHSVVIGIGLLTALTFLARGTSGEVPPVGPSVEGSPDGRATVRVERPPQEKPAESKSEPKTEPKSEPKAEAKAESKPEPKPEAKPKDTPPPKSTPMPMPSPASMPVPAAVAKPAPMPAPLAAEPQRVITSIVVEAFGAAARARKLQPNPVEANPQPLDRLSEREIQGLSNKYFGWSEKEKLQIVLEIGNLSPTQMERLAGGFTLRVEGSAVLIGGTDYRFNRLEDGVRPSRLFGDLPSSKWTNELNAKANDLFTGSAGVEAEFYLSDATTVEMFRQLAAELQRQPELARAEIVFRAKAAGNTVSVDLLTRTRK